MYAFLIFLHVIICLALILVVLLQAGKSGGLSSAFGGSSSALFGGRGATDFLSKMTTGLAVGFMLLSLVLAFLSVPAGKKSVVVDRASDETPVSAVEALKGIEETGGTPPQQGVETQSFPQDAETQTQEQEETSSQPDAGK